MMKKMDADVIVVAAGLSGLAAAIAAAEKGATVIALEKANTTGGAANMGMGPLGVGSRIQKEHMVTITPGEAFRKHMYYTHYRVDARLVRDYYFKSGDTIDWLQDMGVQFLPPSRAFSAPENTRAYSDGEFTWHIVKPESGMPGPRCAGPMVKAMTDRALELGVEIIYESPVKKILMEDGEAIGVLAVNKDGEELEVTGGAVIICTGGFGCNPDMIKELTDFEYGKTIHNFAIPGMDGDGLRMAWEAGASKTVPIMEIMYQIPDNMNHFVIEGAFRQPCLWVNKLGNRFMPEDQIANTTFTGNSIAMQPGKIAFTIFDEAMLENWKKRGGDLISHAHPHDLYDHFDAEWKRDIDAGYDAICEADTIGDLADKAGIDKAALLATVDEYNAMCAAGYDEVFEKDRAYLKPLGTGKLYCCRQNVGAYGSLGGILINHKMEVLDDDHRPIPGLYAAGTDACNIYGDSYTFILSGNTMGFCINSGRIAGESAVDFTFEEE